MPPVDGWWWRAEDFLISLHQGTELKLGINPAPAEHPRVGGLLFAFLQHQHLWPRQLPYGRLLLLRAMSQRPVLWSLFQRD